MIPRHWQRRLVISMQLLLVGILLFGLYQRSIGIVTNAVMTLGITFLPALLERDYEIVTSPGILLWLTTAVFLHSVGALGPYRAIWWWDHVTHTLSAAIVAGAGYAVVRAVDEHNEEISLPPRFLFVFILIFIMAFGVLWELFEHLATIATILLGTGNVLTQYGLEDTLVDLLFDMLGGLLFAAYGTAHTQNVTADIQTRLELITARHDAA